MSNDKVVYAVKFGPPVPPSIELITELEGNTITISLLDKTDGRLLRSLIVGGKPNTTKTDALYETITLLCEVLAEWHDRMKKAGVAL